MKDTSSSIIYMTPIKLVIPLQEDSKDEDTSPVKHFLHICFLSEFKNKTDFIKLHI